MHGEIQTVLKAEESAKNMEAWKKLRELDTLLAAATLAAEAVELHNDDELESQYP
jgi:hypothetical protein